MPADRPWIWPRRGVGPAAGQAELLIPGVGDYVVLAGVLLWLWLRHRESQVRARRTLLEMAVLALVVYRALPMSPPRFALPGIVDVVARCDILGEGLRRLVGADPDPGDVADRRSGLEERTADRFPGGHAGQAVDHTDRMSDVDQPRSPFATESWEPRFALDGMGSDVGLLTCALGLHLHGLNRGYLADLQADMPVDIKATFRGYVLGPSRLAVSAVLLQFPYPLRAGELLFDDAQPRAAAAAVAQWLEDRATYPPKPWFEGGEERGFQAWHVPYGDDSGPYGYLVVEPKWFEVHK